MGAVEPDMGALDNATGIRLRTDSSMIDVAWVQSFNGLIAKQDVMETKGFSIIVYST